MKKFFYGMIALVSVSVFLIGCPTDAGGPGEAGKNIGYVDSAVDAAALATLFQTADIVTLGPKAATVDGVVPAGKKLVVSGKTGISSMLTVDGTVEVYKGAELAGLGYIASRSANSVSVKGMVALPYLTKGFTVPETIPTGYKILSYNDSKLTNKAIGSVDGKPVDETALAELFKTESALAVHNITVVAGMIPAATNTLTLLGTDNKVTSNFAPVGKLVVSKGAVLKDTTAVTLTGATDATAITIDAGGTLDLTNNIGSKIAGKVVNNGTIKSATTTAAIQNTLVTLATGSGTVELSGVGDDVLDSAAGVTLTQNVVIAGNGSKVMAPLHATPFAGNKTITVKSDGTLDFGVAILPAAISGVTIVNEGIITTATVSVPALNAIAALGGKISSTGAVVGDQSLTVPEGTSLEHKTSAFVGGTGKITIDGTATFTAGIFGAQTGAVTVNGTATFAEATFVGLTGKADDMVFTVGPNGNATLSAATFAATTLGKIVINGTATLGAAVITKGDIIVNGMAILTGAAVPTGDVVVGGTLIIGGSGSLRIANGKSLDLKAADGKVVLKGGGTAGKLILGSVNTAGDDGKQTEIAAANADTAANLVTDAKLTATGDKATIAVAVPTATGGAVANGESKAKSGNVNASIVTGKASSSTKTGATATFSSGADVINKSDTVVPAAGGFGKGVTIKGGVISVNLSNSAAGA
jgi:hypothetical protein